MWAWILPLPNTMQAQLEQGLSHGFDGMIVYIDKADQSPQYFAAGWHDKDAKLPARPDALFKIASIGKLYHALAVTKLANSGKLSLDDSVAYHFPELAPRIANAQEITIEMLVKHRSGLFSFTNTPDYWNNPVDSFEQAIELVLISLPTSHPTMTMNIQIPITCCYQS